MEELDKEILKSDVFRKILQASGFDNEKIKGMLMADAVRRFIDTFVLLLASKSNMSIALIEQMRTRALEGITEDSPEAILMSVDEYKSLINQVYNDLIGLIVH